MRVLRQLTNAMRVYLTCSLAWGIVRSDGALAFVVPTTTRFSLQSSLPTSLRKVVSLWSSVSPLPNHDENNNDNDNNSNNERKRLLEMARQLRDEARILEGEVRHKPRLVKSDDESDNTIPRTPKIVTDLKDSTWTISYRFTSQPNDTDQDSSNSSCGSGASVLPSYSGKVTILLKADGYSELVATTAAAADTSPLEIVKVWGWDEEYSQEDQQQQYLLFSMDVRLPKNSDSRLQEFKNKEQRYYFQARIDRKKKNSNNNNSGGEISLKDGTITVKKDVAEKTQGRWGLFRVEGILTQFRYVGDFIAKPL